MLLNNFLMKENKFITFSLIKHIEINQKKEENCKCKAKVKKIEMRVYQ